MNRRRLITFGKVLPLAWLGRCGLVNAGSGALFPLFGAQGVMQGSSDYKVNHARSYLLAVTGKSGLFSFAGHQHAILASTWSVEFSINRARLMDSSATISVPVSSLIIDSPEARRLARLGSGPGAADVEKIQAKMVGPDVLDGAKYPTIRFSVGSVEIASTNKLRATGQFQIHGQTHQVSVPMGYTEGSDGSLSFSGEATIRQSDFGLEAQSIGFGAVTVKDEVSIRFHLSIVPVFSQWDGNK